MTEVILHLDLPVTGVGLVEADEPQEASSELQEKITAKLRTEFEAQARQLQQQTALEQAELAKTRQALSQAVTQVEQIQTQAIEEMRQQAADLAVAIAGKIIAQEVQAQRVDIDPIVQEALRQLPARGEIVIHLNPADLERSQFAKQADDVHTGELKFVSDPNIPQAGCFVESVEGSVESTIDSSLEKVGEALHSPEGE